MEMYEAGFYVQDALIRNCETERCRVGYLCGNENSGGLTIVDSKDTGSQYSLVVEYGGNGATVSNFVSDGATTRALQILGQHVTYTNIAIKNFKGTGAPIMVGKMGKLIYADAPSHKADMKRYLDMPYTVSGRFDILSTITQRDDLVEVWDGSTMNWDGFTMHYLAGTTQIGSTEPATSNPVVVDPVIPAPLPSPYLKYEDFAINVYDEADKRVDTFFVKDENRKLFRGGDTFRKG